MTRPNLSAAAARRSTSSGSFHAGDAIPTLSSLRTITEGHPSTSASPATGSQRHRARRKAAAPRKLPLRRASSHHYQTFPTPPPKTPSDGRPSSSFDDEHDHDAGSSSAGSSDSADGENTPLPIRQLCLLALLSLCEQTALNSISPYLPTMIESLPEISDAQTGVYVGLLASAFALAQLATNFLWGHLSDRVGRKPMMLLGTTLLAVCFAAFGFCKTYWQIVLVHVAMGLLNGNAAVVPTCLGEVTDRSNQSKAFTWLPVMYSIGSITGPALGGLLVGGHNTKYPFLGPNVGSAALLLASVVVLAVWFEETLEKEPDWSLEQELSSQTHWLKTFLTGSRKADKGPEGSWSARWPRGGQRVSQDRESFDSDSDSDSNISREDHALLSSHDAPATDDAKRSVESSHSHDEDEQSPEESHLRQVMNQKTVILLGTYLVFQLSNISFNSLYPIFATADPPTGRGLSPDRIGLSLSFAGLVTIVFQIFLFERLKSRIGNLGTYRWSLLGIAIATALMPWVSYLEDDGPGGPGSGRWWLYGELGVVLVVKNICAVGGLSSVMLLITNSAPSHECLGTLNGAAQTLSAAGRSVGPFLSGGLFTLSEGVQPKGEAVAWGIFAGIALVGWLGTLAIRGKGLESADWMGDETDSTTSDQESQGSGDDVERQT